MTKKITTEKKIDNDWFKLKIGTMDKKEPSVVYLEGGIFIKPNKKKDDYRPSIKNINTCFHDEVKNIYSKTNNIFSQNYISNFEIADERMKYNKSTYLSFQFFLRQTGQRSYNELFDAIAALVPEISLNLVNCIKSNDFDCSKRKN